MYVLDVVVTVDHQDGRRQGSQAANPETPTAEPLRRAAGVSWMRGFRPARKP
jgi:hypothetical protein